MRKPFLSCAIAAALCAVWAVPSAAFAAEDHLPLSTGSSDIAAQAQTVEIKVYSVDELLGVVKRANAGASASSPYRIKLEKPASTAAVVTKYDIGQKVSIPAHTSIDLNGQTVVSNQDYVFSIAGEGVSVSNGTLEGTGIVVSASDGSGAISGVKVVSPSAYGIYVNAGKAIGSISGNAISNASIAMNVKGTVNGSISNNTLSGCTDPDHGAIYLNGGGNVAGKIANNTFSGNKGRGIQLFSKASCGGVEGNSIDGGTIGINVQDGGVVKGDISNNSVRNCTDSEHGSIYLVNGGVVTGAIAKNKISGGKGHGIQLFSKATSGNIEGNEITDMGNYGISLNGSSSDKSNDGCAAGDIAGNTLRNIAAHGISIYHGSHVGKITRNTLDTIGGLNTGGKGDFGIIVNCGTDYSKTYAQEITHNTVSNVSYASIVVFSGPEGDTTGKRQDFGYVSGDIAYNTVNNNGTAKKGFDWNKKQKIPSEGAIYVDSHARVYGSIHHNTVSTSHDDGIRILAYSSVKSIHHNTISNAKYAGISVMNRSTVTGAINDNTIKNSGFYGIFVNTSSKAKGKISKNKITNSGQNGISVNQKSSTGTVSGNKMTGVKMYGVFVGSDCTMTKLLNNSIAVKNAKKGYGVIVNKKGRIASIQKNSISGKFNCGIGVKQASGSVKILSNTMKVSGKAASYGIFIDSCKKSVAITSNKITGNNTKAGIFVRKSGKTTAKKNTVKKSPREVYFA